MVFPSAFKGMVSGDEEMRFVVKKDIFQDCLEMYTFSEWGTPERGGEVPS